MWLPHADHEVTAATRAAAGPSCRTAYVPDSKYEMVSYHVPEVRPPLSPQLISWCQAHLHEWLQLVAAYGERFDSNNTEKGRRGEKLVLVPMHTLPSSTFAGER